MKKGLLRIVDANLNRSREGIRVCEEIVRFVLDDVSLTKEFKTLRHRITYLVREMPEMSKLLLESRASNDDVGRKILNNTTRKDYKDVFIANIQRVKESLRVLEEFSRLICKTLSKNFTQMRFKVYALEKKTIKKLQKNCRNLDYM
jgi:thiamine-phosphate pyrophosphorylase